MIKTFLTFLAFTVSVAATAAPLWMRYNVISPKGDKIAFSYKGDIYTVNSKGGDAIRLTTNSAYDFAPVWSPDGSQIAFATDRNGNFDVYLVSSEGGEAVRLTTNSSTETPLSFSNDGKEVYYSAAIQDPASSAQFTSGWISELYKVSVKGSRPELITAVPMMSVAFSKNGKTLLYENRTGSENVWRKHHTSSVAHDIYEFDLAKGTHKQITDNKGEDRNALYATNGSEIYFLSERDGGTFNVYKSDINDTKKAKAVTSFKDHPVRFLSQSSDGTLCYGYQGEIYTQAVNGKAQKVNINIVNDLQGDQITQKTLRSADEYSMTPDGRQIAIVARGEVFVTTDKYPTTKKITDTPEAERSVTISPDGRTLVYASERGGMWSLYTAKIGRKEEINFANATVVDEKLLFSDNKIERFAPQFSADGKELAFIEDRKFLKVLNLESNKVRQITDGSQYYGNSDSGFDYSWSPDGKWFALTIITNVRDPYSDIAIVSSNGGKTYNITNSGYIDHSPRWALDGNAIIYTSNRLGMRSHASWGSQEDVFLAFLNQESYDKYRMTEEDLELIKEAKKLAEKEVNKDSKEKKDSEKDADKKAEEKKAIEIDLDKLDRRVVRLTPMSSELGSAILSKDGETLYFTASFEDGVDLWEVDLKERSVKMFKKNIGYGMLELDKDGKNLYVFGSRPQKIALSSKNSTPMTFSGVMDLNSTKERAYMFDHVVKQEIKRFYNSNYHGVDLPKLKTAYLPYLSHISNNYDYAEFLSEFLGELNVSHTGSGYSAPAKEGADVTSELGLLYSWSYKGDGLLIDEVVEYGPFDNNTSKVKKGHIIEKIDGVQIKANEDYYPLLNKKTGRKVLISIYDPATKTSWEEVIKPISKGSLSSLLYKRWIKTRAEEVDRLSGGRLGYVHIQSMADGSYRDVYSDILGKYNSRDGIVIDTRFNGGGRLHEDIEVLFSGEKYLEQVIQGRVTCDMPSRRYNKPSIMLMNEANYSNAHGTPWVYKYKKMGSLVGMPVPGTMTSVNWETLQDPTLYFGIPVIGYRTQDGVYLENSQIEPDFKVVNTPEKIVKGVDEQLEVAVKELLKQIDSKKRW